MGDTTKGKVGIDPKCVRQASLAGSLLKIQIPDEKHQTYPNWEPFYKITGQYASKLNMSEKTKTEELSQIGVVYGDMTTNWKGGSWIGSWQKKKKQTTNPMTDKICIRSLNKLIGIYKCLFSDFSNFLRLHEILTLRKLGEKPKGTITYCC